MSNSITKQLVERWAAEDDDRDYVAAGAVDFEHYEKKYSAPSVLIEKPSVETDIMGIGMRFGSFSMKSEEFKIEIKTDEDGIRPAVISLGQAVGSAFTDITGGIETAGTPKLPAKKRRIKKPLSI